MYPPEANKLGKPTHIAQTKRRAAIQLAFGRGLTILIVLFITTTTLEFLCGIMALWIIFEAILLWGSNRKLLLAKNGLVHVRRQQVRLIPWDNINAIYWRHHRLAAFGRDLSEEQVFVVHLNDDRPLTYSTDTFRDLAELGEAMLGAHARHLMPETIAGFDDGQTISFSDSIDVDQEGIHIGTTTVPWEKVAWKNEGHVLFIGDGDTWHRVASIGDIPNYQLLINLLEYAKQ